MVLSLDEMRRGSSFQPQQRPASDSCMQLPRSNEPPGQDAIAASARFSGCSGTLLSLRVSDSADCCHHKKSVCHRYHGVLSLHTAAELLRPLDAP